MKMEAGRRQIGDSLGFGGLQPESQPPSREIVAIGCIVRLVNFPEGEPSFPAVQCHRTDNSI